MDFDKSRLITREDPDKESYVGKRGVFADTLSDLEILLDALDKKNVHTLERVDDDELPFLRHVAKYKYFYCVPSKEIVMFGNATEFADANRNEHAPEGTEPLVWIRNKHSKTRCFVTWYGGGQDQYVGTADGARSMKNLFEDYEYLDGSPIGKEVIL